MFPTGIAYVSAALKQAGTSVSCLDLYHYPREQHVDLLKRRIQDEAIEVHGTTGLSQAYADISRILSVARQHRPELITDMGGGLFSGAPELLSVDLNLSIGVI